jgi:hypothetical protein
MTKVKDDPRAEALIAAGYDPETEVDYRELTEDDFKLALASLEHAAEDKNYAAWLRDEFQMHQNLDHDASEMPMDRYVALISCFRRGLENPKGNIAKLMKKSGFDSLEVLRGIRFDFTPEQ